MPRDAAAAVHLPQPTCIVGDHATACVVKDAAAAVMQSAVDIRYVHVASLFVSLAMLAIAVARACCYQCVSTVIL